MGQEEPLDVGKEIIKKVQLLEHGRGKINALAQAKAKTLVEHKKQVAIAIAKHRADGVPVSVMDKLIYEDKLVRDALYEMEMAEVQYKALIVKMDSIKAELNGYQSINRFLSEL